MTTLVPRQPFGRTSRSRRGLAIVEVASLVALAGVLASVGIVANPLAKSRESARMLKDATQVRVISQGMIVWSSNNKDQYPLPSLIDTRNTTVADIGEAKDTTGNIFSILVFNASITDEILVSPLENNPKIKIHGNYAFVNPAAAANPAMALWDPSLSGDMNSAAGGHISYAHLQPSSGRLARWASTFNAEEAVLASRGPQITGVTVTAPDTATPTFANDKSRTFGVFRYAAKPGFWSGNVAFNDNHIEFIANHFAPKTATVTSAQYEDAKGKKLPDMAFYDEPDDAAGINNAFGIFIKAGPKRENFVGAWD
ncbi:MAG: hypothetical protein K2X32_01160 [Phycisphaerales bacterium]|nr:hypothetical protein [Phycisphaerales bacterium]